MAVAADAVECNVKHTRTAFYSDFGVMRPIGAGKADRYDIAKVFVGMDDYAVREVWLAHSASPLLLKSIGGIAGERGR